MLRLPQRLPFSGPHALPPRSLRARRPHPLRLRLVAGPAGARSRRRRRASAATASASASCWARSASSSRRRRWSSSLRSTKPRPSANRLKDDSSCSRPAGNRTPEAFGFGEKGRAVLLSMALATSVLTRFNSHSPGPEEVGHWAKVGSSRSSGTCLRRCPPCGSLQVPEEGRRSAGPRPVACPPTSTD